MIRQAEKRDKKEAAVLMYEAILDIAHSLTGEKTKEKAIDQLAAFFSQDGNRLSYQNCLVKELNGKVVGLVLTYHGKDAKVLDAPIKQYLQYKFNRAPVIDQEADEPDFYIDTVSVHHEFQNQKIGTELSQAAIKLGKEQEYKISLVVEENNRHAKKLYKRLGFTYKKTITISNHLYEYMIID